MIPAILAFAAFCAVPASAQQPEPKKGPAPSLEAFGGVIGGFLDMAGTSTMLFEWQDLTGWIGSAKSSSTLTFDAGTSVGFDIGANLFLSRRFGIQVRAEHLSASLQGPGGVLTWTDAHGNASVPWPGAHGESSHWLVSFNGIVRGRVAKNWTWTASGGLSYLAIHTDVGDFGYWNFPPTRPPGQLGGSAETKAVLANVGAGLAIPIGSRFAVVTDFRYFMSGRIDLPFMVTYVPGNLQHLTFTASSLNPSYPRLFVGLQCTLWRKPGVDIVDGWKGR